MSVEEAGTDQRPTVEPEVTVRETYEYGRLWPDGTFDEGPWSDETMGRRVFEERRYELRNVPEALRPVFGRRRVVTTTQIFEAEQMPEKTP